MTAHAGKLFRLGASAVRTPPKQFGRYIGRRICAGYGARWRTRYLSDTGDEGRAVRIANAAVAKAKGNDEPLASDRWSENSGF